MFFASLNENLLVDLLTNRIELNELAATLVVSLPLSSPSPFLPHRRGKLIGSVQFLKSFLYLISLGSTLLVSMWRFGCRPDQSKRGFRPGQFSYGTRALIPVGQYLRFNGRISFPSCFRTWSLVTGHLLLAPCCGNDHATPPSLPGIKRLSLPQLIIIRRIIPSSFSALH